MRWDEKRERGGEETGEEGKAKKVTRQAYRQGDIVKGRELMEERKKMARERAKKKRRNGQK